MLEKTLPPKSLYVVVATQGRSSPIEWNNRVGEPIIWCLDRSEPVFYADSIDVGIRGRQRGIPIKQGVIFECFGGCSINDEYIWGPQIK